MSERHAVTTEDLANQEYAPEPRQSQEPVTDEFPEQREPDFEREPEDLRPEADETVADEAVADEPVADEPVADEPVAETPPAVVETPKTTEPQRTPLFENDDIDRFREDWRSLQGDFVDDPRAAVQQADELVAEVMQAMATTFAEHKRTLEEQWSQGDEVQTEDLRLALQQYRVFFHQLLAV